MDIAIRHRHSRVLWLVPGAALICTFLVSSCADVGAAGGGSAVPSSNLETTASASAISAAEEACGKRPDASGDIYVRMIQPGQAPVAQQLGGEWVWNVTLNKCLTSVQMMIATAPKSPGTCTQVGYVADNPGYNVNADTAKPLKNVAAQTGPAC